LQDQKKRQVAAAATLAPQAPAGPRLLAEAEKQLLTLLREGRAAEANQLAKELAKSAPPPAPVQSTQMSASPARPEVNVGTLVEHYLKTKKGPDALAARSYDAQKSASLARLLGGIAAMELTAAELTLYERKRRADHFSERTIREELKVLRQALELGVGSGLVERDALEGLGRPVGRAGPRASKDSAR
jgi:hypothetical protein